MIKIIYGVKENSSDCELIFPKQDRIGLLDLIKQDIIKNDASENAEGTYVYSIYCISNYYVFSKINITKDSSKRVSYRAFIIVLEQSDTDCYHADFFVLGEIDKLETQYIDGELIEEQNCLNQIKIDNNMGRRPLRIFNYKDQNELKNHFLINSNYKQYEITYFIDKKFCNEPVDPKNVLKGLDYITAVDLDNKYLEDAPRTLGKSRYYKKVATITSAIFVLLLFGVFGFLSCQKIIDANAQIVKLSEEIRVLNHSLDSVRVQITELRTEIQIMKDKKIENTKTSKVETVQPAINKIINTPTANILPEIESFLIIDCRQMTLKEIKEQIKEYRDKKPDRTSIVRLSYFQFLIDALEENPITLTALKKMQEFELNSKFEYTKFYKYLKGKDANFLSNKKIDNINDWTLEKIEKHYEFIQ